MDDSRLAYDISTDSWVLFPFSCSQKRTLQHSNLEPFSPVQYRRTSSDIISSSSSVLSICQSPLESPSSALSIYTSPVGSAMGRSKSGSHGWFWGSLNCFTGCLDTKNSIVEKKERSGKRSSHALHLRRSSHAARKISSVHSVRSSPDHADSYSGMNDEERDESLQAAINYCNNSKVL